MKTTSFKKYLAFVIPALFLGVLMFMPKGAQADYYYGYSNGYAFNYNYNYSFGGCCNSGYGYSTYPSGYSYPYDAYGHGTGGYYNGCNCAYQPFNYQVAYTQVQPVVYYSYPTYAYPSYSYAYPSYGYPYYGY